ncbi:ATP-dependent 6-phosphofructokinase [Clostridiaceae bacterium]|jgi:6-phosphofructokinase 1|uniref:ATP-dependent 6-phosphofructokinase n=1 Tax=Luoshenia tenuis TaxID=2763654 RepID=UPI0008222C05|nr:6-phosphofructokinase [uncultured Clostridium sp.]
MKRIAVLTSGGDAPGMNAALGSVVRSATQKGMEVFGVEQGYLGLIEDRMQLMEPMRATGMVTSGGTLLGTMRCSEMKTEEGRLKAVETIRKHGIEGLVAIGGDGTFRGAEVLCGYGVPTIGIPGTIDNDLAYTQYTLGFDTTLNTIVRMATQIRDTMASHERVCVMEVMGRHCGDLALYSAAALHAEALIVPEMPWDVDSLCQRLERQRANGRRSALVVMAEGAGKATELAPVIMEKTGFDTRASVLGYVQRGGQPSPRDLLMATRMGVRAVELLHQGIGNRVLGQCQEEIVDFDINEALDMPAVFNKELYELVQGLWA